MRLPAAALALLVCCLWCEQQVHAAVATQSFQAGSIQPLAVRSGRAAAEPLFLPGEPWLDTDGELIQAHGGGILLHEGVYYWYGENKNGPSYRAGQQQPPQQPPPPHMLGVIRRAPPPPPTPSSKLPIGPAPPARHHKPPPPKHKSPRPPAPKKPPQPAPPRPHSPPPPKPVPQPLPPRPKPPMPKPPPRPSPPRPKPPMPKPPPRPSPPLPPPPPLPTPPPPAPQPPSPPPPAPQPDSPPPPVPGPLNDGPPPMLRRKGRRLSRYTSERVDIVGVSCYSSTDLHTWHNEGLVLKAGQHSDLAPDRVLERPKVLYNSRTAQFVMWMHIDNAYYEEAKVGVAVSNSPTGPFTYRGSFRPNDQMARDMNLFQDDDGSAYLIYSSEENAVMHITQLAPDYLRVEKNYSRAFVGLSREAPAMFKHQGRYFMLTSGCTGWDPNMAGMFVAPAPGGPWTALGDPCRSSDSGDCPAFFHSQSTYVLPAPRGKKGSFIMMADRWNKQELGLSRYIWLPMWVEPAPAVPARRAAAVAAGAAAGAQWQVTVRWFDAWNQTVFARPQPTLVRSLRGAAAVV